MDILTGRFSRYLCVFLLASFFQYHLYGSGDQAGAALKSAIKSAGNADDDSVRLQILKEIRRNEVLTQTQRTDVDTLIDEIERWIGEKRLDYFGRKVSQDIDYDFGIDKESLFYNLTYIYRGRMVVWYALESGGVWNNPRLKKIYMDKAVGFFEKAHKAFPKNRIVSMYLGKPIERKAKESDDSDAPQWAVYQRQSLEALTDVIEWWIDNRMRDNGEYGGGWGDDCEMWRWQVPVLIGFESKKINLAQRRFSEAIMSQDHMKRGYTTKITDVEHTAEDSADAITPMMHLDPKDETWQNKALLLADLMENLWTGKNQKGLLQFKSTYFCVDRVDNNPVRACDTVYHPRTVQPTLLYWQRTGDKKLTRLFRSWMDTWVDVTAKSQGGKPAGIIPSAIHWPDGQPGGTSPDWWDPRNHGEYTLYLWPSAMSLMTDTMLLTWYMTGDEKYLAPLRSMAKIQMDYLDGSIEDTSPGSAGWCAQRMDKLAGTLAKYRFLSGSDEFDKLLDRRMSAYMRFRLRENRETLTEQLKDTARSFRYNFPGYTSEVRYTDRVLRFPRLFDGNGLTNRRVEEICAPDTDLLYSCVTGDPGSAGYMPLNAVRWLTEPRNIAVMVTDSGSDRFAAELYHFGLNSRVISAELFLLKSGNYKLTLSEAGSGKVIKTGTVSVNGTTKINLTLPAGKLCLLTIGRI